jgi:ADP-ribose pyrophosphatase YjhB (NUDIX family)
MIRVVPDRTVSEELASIRAERGWAVEDDGTVRVTRLAAYGLIRRDGRLLLCRTAPGNLGVGMWTLPGGGIVFGETPEAGAVREVEEETGFVGRITGPPVILSDTGLWPVIDPPIPYHQVRFVYPMAIAGGEERVEVGGSTDAFDWFAEAELETLPIVPLVLLGLRGIGGSASGRENG